MEHVGQFLSLRHLRMPEEVRAASVLVSVVAAHDARYGAPAAR